MERSGSMLRALFVGIEPIVVGLATNQQRLVLIGLCNIGIILLWHNTQPQAKSPITSNVFSYRSQLHKFRTQNNYFGAIGFLGFIGGILSYALQQGDQFDKISFALISGGLIYWLLAIIVHGIRNTCYAKLSKIFLGLIVVGAGRSFLGSNKGELFIDDVPNAFIKLFAVPKAVAPTMIINTGSLDIPKQQETSITPPTPSTGSTNTGDLNTDTNNTGNIIPPLPSAPVATGTTTSRRSNTPIQYTEVVPAIVKAFGLVAVGPDISFTNISKTDPLYPAFKAGYNAKFFGQGVNPHTTTSCNVYFVMVGLAGKWPVSYTPSTVFTAYAAEAERRGKTYGCKPGAYVTSANLPQ